jgi:hypothetical protein
VKIPLRPKYLLIHRLRKNITLSGRRWKTHGSSKESGGKEAGKEGSGKEDRSKEEIIFFDEIISLFLDCISLQVFLYGNFLPIDPEEYCISRYHFLGGKPRDLFIESMIPGQHRILHPRGGRAVYFGFGGQVDNGEDHIIVFPVFLHTPGTDSPKYTPRPPAFSSGF